MQAKNQAFAILPTPHISHYPLPLIDPVVDLTVHHEDKDVHLQ